MENQNIPEAQPVAEQPQAAQTPAGQGASGRAVAALILGILSIICMGFLAGIPAIILGSMELKTIKAGAAPAAGESAAKVGYILGIIGTVLSCITMLIFFIMVALGVSMGTMGAMQQTTALLFK
jgi:hypothetical protein